METPELPEKGLAFVVGEQDDGTYCVVVAKDGEIKWIDVEDDHGAPLTRETALHRAGAYREGAIELGIPMGVGNAEDQ